MPEAEARGLVDVVHQAARGGHHDVSQAAEAVGPEGQRAARRGPCSARWAGSLRTGGHTWPFPSRSAGPRPHTARGRRDLRLLDEALLLLGQRLLPGDQGHAQRRGIRVEVEHFAHLEAGTGVTGCRDSGSDPGRGARIPAGPAPWWAARPGHAPGTRLAASGPAGGGCHLCHQGQHPACQPLSEGRVLTLTCTTGMTKASVFPLPVGAETQRSLGR